MLLGAWIGSVLATDLRRGVVVPASSVVFSTSAFLLISRVIPIDQPRSDTALGAPPSWHGSRPPRWRRLWLAA